MNRAQYVIFGAVLVASCQTREISESAPAPKGELIFSDDFDRVDLGPKWRRGVGEGGSGRWLIRDGWLQGRSIKNDSLWLTVPLPLKSRVEFDAKSTTSEGDLKFEIFGDGKTHASGYIVIFGGWKNSLDVIARLDEHGKDRKSKPSLKVEPNRVYHLVAERSGSTLRFSVDGARVIEFEDAEPLMGEAHAYFAFSDWMAPVQFDNVRVYSLE